MNRLITLVQDNASTYAQTPRLKVKYTIESPTRPRLEVGVGIGIGVESLLGHPPIRGFSIPIPIATPTPIVQERIILDATVKRGDHHE